MGMIRKLKFNQQLIYAKALGALLAAEARELWYAGQPLPDCIIPVPLHPDRLKERGFNQSLEIAHHVGLGIELDFRSVRRIKPTLAQSGLSKTARRNNMQGAFACEARFDGLHVAILDDVVTTGQTITELNKVVEQQGASRVDIWCCARA